MKTKIKKTSSHAKKKNKYNKAGGALGLLGVAGLVGYGLMKKNMKSKTSSGGFQSIKELQNIISQEQEANKKLVTHINSCNKEVIRLQGLLSKKPSIYKEVLLRNTIKKLTQKK